MRSLRLQFPNIKTYIIQHGGESSELLSSNDVFSSWNSPYIKCHVDVTEVVSSVQEHTEHRLLVIPARLLYHSTPTFTGRILQNSLGPLRNDHPLI